MTETVDTSAEAVERLRAWRDGGEPLRALPISYTAGDTLFAADVIALLARAERAEAERDAFERNMNAAATLAARYGAERDVARAERDRYAEREMHFARALRVADGGQYRHDWDAAIRLVIEARDAARAEAAMAIELLNACVKAHETGKYDPICGAIERVRAALAAKEPGHE